VESDRRWYELERSIEPLQHAVLSHPVYHSLHDRRALHIFMQHHVWAVWDFMSLLTRLQRDLTCVELPWVPRPVDAAVQRFVNEIKLGEESDAHPDGGWTSHFDLYLAAMDEVGADSGPVRAAVGICAAGGRSGPGVVALRDLLARCGAPHGAIGFVESTFDLVARGTTLDVATAFALGREQLIPEMFEHLVDGTEGRLLLEYLRRHVELDEGEHGPMARRLVEQLVGDDAAGWFAVERAAASAIAARIGLWDAVVAATEAARVPAGA
jgi:hypothetical protein